MTDSPTLAVPVRPVPTLRPALQMRRRSMAAVVLFFVLVGHAWSVTTGLFLDDHAHYANLRDGGWSFESAINAAQLHIVGQVMDLWGSPAQGLRPFRPVAFWIMHAEYAIVHWHPMGMHFFSLGWHFLCSMLVGELVMRCLGRRLWATVGGSLMAIHPGHMVTVYWIACQTELITTAFLLLGILAYSRAAGWGWHASTQAIRPWLVSDAESGRPAPNTAARISLLLLTLICYGLALGCRENAVFFPLICWLGDRWCGTHRPRRFRWEHVAMIGVLAAYAIVRMQAFGGLEVPRKPYVYPMSDPGFVRFIIEKIVYYTLGLFSFVPVVPRAGQFYFSTRPLAFYGSFVGVMGLLLVIWRAYRFPRAFLWAAAWAALLIAPLLPVFASCHHLYLPSAGAIVLLTAGFAALGGLARRVPGPVPRPQLVTCGFVLALHAVGLSLFTWALGFCYDAGTRAEDIVVQEILQRSSALHDGDDLFFINFPILAYYAVPAVEAQTGRRNLHGHVLTFSPDMLRMSTPGGVEIISEHAIRVSSPAGMPYFAGISGEVVCDVLGFERVPRADTAMRADHFTITPTQASSEGISELLFTFDRPVNSPNYHFFFGSPQFLAYPLERLVATRPSAGASTRAGS